MDSKKEEEQEKVNIPTDACKLTVQELKSFLTYLPNLQSIDFNKSGYYKSYMACLADLDSTRYLQHIKDISSK